MAAQTKRPGQPIKLPLVSHTGTTWATGQRGCPRLSTIAVLIGSEQIVPARFFAVCTNSRLDGATHVHTAFGVGTASGPSGRRANRKSRRIAELNEPAHAGGRSGDRRASI